MSRTRVGGGLALMFFSSLAAAQAPAPGATISPMMGQQLASLAQILVPGQQAIVAPSGGFGFHRRPLSLMVQLAAGHCYTFLGAGGAGVVDLDLFVFNPAGKRVAADVRYDTNASVLYCATFDGAHRVELKVKRGEGEVGFQAFEGAAAASPYAPPPTAYAPQPAAAPPAYAPPPPAAAPAPAYAEAPPQQVAPQPIPANDFLAQQLGAFAAAAVPGQQPYGGMIGGFSADGHGQDLYVPLEAGRCYTVLTVGAPTVRALSTYLWEPGRGRRLATDRARGNTSRLSICAALPGAYHFQAKAESGAGEFRAAVYTQ